MIENGNAEALGLVGEIAGDAGAREDDDAGGHDLEHAVVALEGRGLAVGGPVGFEGDLRDLSTCERTKVGRQKGELGAQRSNADSFLK